MEAVETRRGPGKKTKALVALAVVVAVALVAATGASVFRRGQPRVFGAHVDSHVLAFSPSGELLAGVSPSGKVALWSTRDGSLVASVGEEAEEAVYVAIAVSPSDDRIAVAERNQPVTVYGIRGGEPRTLATNGWISSLAFSPSGRLLAGGSRPGPFRGALPVNVWNLGTGQCTEHRAAAKEDDLDPWEVVFASEHELHAVKNTRLWAWDLDAETEPRIVAQDLGVSDVCFSPRGDVFAVSDLGAHSVDLRSVATGKLLGKTAVGIDSRLRALSDGGELLACAASGIDAGPVLVFATADGRCVGSFEGPAGTACEALALSPRGDAVAAVFKPQGDGPGWIYLWPIGR